MSYVTSFYHIIISTHNRVPSLTEERREDLYRYIWGIVKKNNCKLLRINGMADHIHMLLELSSCVSLSDIVHEIKRGSSYWLKKNSIMPGFDGWTKEYAAFSCRFEDKERIKTYIINQQEHHKNNSFEYELEMNLKRNGLTLFKK